jgi:hypothetical protein
MYSGCQQMVSKYTHNKNVKYAPYRSPDSALLRRLRGRYVLFVLLSCGCRNRHASIRGIISSFKGDSYGKYD